MTANDAALTWTIAPVEVAGRYHFGIACGKESTPESDPVAHSYRGGNLANINPLLDVALAVLKPGDRVLDLGAHLGGFALTAAAIGCKVIAVEAAPRNAALLRQSVAYNQFLKLHVVHACVGDAAGTVEFSCHGPFGHLASPVTGMPSIAVPAMRVDDLLEERGWADVQFIKLDVEGSEVRAVRGMEKLLSRSDAPLVYFESNQHTLSFYSITDAELKAEFRRLGFVVYHMPRPGEFVVTNDGDVQTETVVDYLAAKALPEALTGAARRIAA